MFDLAKSLKFNYLMFHVGDYLKIKLNFESLTKSS